jgi:hypothetical protein
MNLSNRFEKAIEKNVEDSFKFVLSIEQPNKFIIESKNQVLNQGEAETYIEMNQFCLAFYPRELLDQDKRNELLDSDTSFKIINENLNLIFDFKSFTKISIPLMKDPARFECNIRKYFNEEIKSLSKRYFRVIIPTQKPQEPGGIFETDSIKIGSIIYSSGLLSINYNYSNYHLFPHRNKQEDKNYLIIESLFKTNFGDFVDNISTILLSYAFVTGYYPRDLWYILSSDESTFNKILGIYYETLPKSLTSSYSVFPSSKYRIYFQLPHNIEFPKKTFDELCSITSRHEELARVLYLIAEGHTLSIELRAAIYTIALEAVTNIISDENISTLKPIPNKKLGRVIIKEMKNIFRSYRNQISHEGFNTINKKLDTLNTSTNTQKLLKPFEILGIKLNPKEIKCIGKRNDFLHGRIPQSSYGDDKSYILEQTSLTILYCVTALVLKFIGYSGFVMYYPTLNEFSKKKSISDVIIKQI